MAKYELEDRLNRFSKAIRIEINKTQKRLSNIDDLRQLIRSSGSISANYAEACAAESRKDFVHKLKIVRKEARETKLWLELTDLSPELLRESVEVIKILTTIILKSGG